MTIESTSDSEIRKSTKGSARHWGARRKRTTMVLPAVLLLGRSLLAMAFLALHRKSIGMRTYLVGCGLTVVACWLVSLSYLALAPATFTSRWSLILPTSSSSVSLQLESIGHAQTVASSPFGSASLSPKVIYKEIIGSEQVRLTASNSLGMTLSQFGTARVKLIDETALVLIEINGRSPVEARAKAAALNSAFEQELDVLRHDEIKRRSDVVKDSLTVYKESLMAARQRIMLQQEMTGVLSINQFNEAASSLEQIRRRLSDVRAEIDKLRAEQKLMVETIGLTADASTRLLKAAGDPLFTKLASELAEVSALHLQEGRRLGEANPILVNLRHRSEKLDEKIRSLLGDTSAGAPYKFPLFLVANGSQSGDMMRALVTNSVLLVGRNAEAASLEAESLRLTAQVRQMSRDAARLEDLKKDHIVAEAVFTSALARLDTNRVDIYASYPMVQTLAAPDLPEKKSNPGALIIVLCAFVASILSIGGWSMAWLRRTFVQKRLKNV